MTEEIERRIVEMQFENEQFEKGARQSLSTLEKLDNFLDNMGAAGIDKISGALDELTYRFSAFGIAGAEAVRKVTDRVIGLAANMLRAVPEQIISGGLNRAFNLEESQFRLEGLGVQWEHIKDDMEYAVNETAYGLDEAAQAASILAGAQIDWTNNVEGASDMAHALRAISGVAAMTGSSYSDIAAVLTDVAAAGRVTGDVVTRLAYRGMNVTAALAKGMGKSQAEIQKMFDEGTLSVQEFYRAMDKAFGEHATEANKTYSGSLMNINAALSRIGADFISPLHKNLIPVNNALREMFNRLRKITQPFAEGPFTSYLERIGTTLKNIIERVDFGWIKPGLDMFGKLLGLIDKAATKLFNFVQSIRRVFEPVINGIDERTGVPFKFIDEKAQNRLNKLIKIFTAVKRAFQMGRDILRKFGETINKVFGGSLGKVLDYILGKLAKLSDLFMGNTGAIWMKVLGFFEKLEHALTIVKKIAVNAFHIVEKVFKIVWNALSKVWKFLKDIGAFEALGKAVKWIGDHMLIASERTGDFLGRLNEAIQTGSGLDVLRTVFGGIGDAIGTAFNTLKEFGAYLFGLKEGETIFDKFRPIFEGIGKFATPIFEELGKAFQGFFSGENNALQAAVKLFAALWGFRKIQKIVWGFERGQRGGGFLKTLFGDKGPIKIFESWLKVLNPKEWAVKIQVLLDRTGQALRSFSNNLDAGSLLKIGGGILMLALALSILASVAEDEEAVTRGMTALTGLMVELVAAMAAMKRITTGSLFKDIAMSWEGLFNLFKNGIGRLLNILSMKELAKSILYFAAAVLVMVVAVGALAYMFTKLEPEDVWRAVAAVGALVVMLIAMMATMGVIIKISKAADLFTFAGIGAALVGMALAIVVLSGAVAIFAKILQQENGLNILGWAVVAVGTLVAVLVVAVAALSKIGTNPAVRVASKAMKDVAWALMITAGAMWVMSEALKKFEGMKWQTIATGATVLMSVITILSLVSKYVANVKGLTTAAWSLLITAAAMRVMAGAFSAFDKAIGDDPTSFIMFIGMLGAMTVALIALSSISATVSASSTALIKVAAAMVVASIAIGALGVALMLYENTSIDTVMNMGLTLAAVGVAFKLISQALNPKDVALSALSLTLAAISLAGIGIAMQLFEGIKMDDVASMFVSLLAVVAAVVVLSALGKEALIGALALAAIGLSMLVVAPGLKKFGQALPALADGLRAFEGINLAEIGAALGGAIVTALFAMLALPFLAFGASGVEVLTAFGAALPILAAGIAAFGSVSGWDLVKLLGGVATGIGSILAIKLARNGVNDFYTVAVGLEKIADAVVKIPDNIGQILRDFAKGIEKGIPEIRNALNDLSDFMVGKFNNDTMRRNWIIIGHNIVVGITNGINQNAYIAQNAMTNLANSLQRQFTVRLSIHSPSRVFEHLAEYIPKGIAIGIQNGQSEVTDAMMSSMSGAVSYMEQIGKNTSDYAPSIRPVMDLGGMRSSMLYADQMLRGSSLGRMGNISGLNVSGDSINYNMQNRDVVSEIQILETKIGALGKAIENLQLVMDTGLVVGALAPQMNSQLGVMAVREGRQ